MVIVGVVFGVMMLGILAAVAIPAYQDYTHRARSAGAILSANPWRAAVAEYYAEHGKLPNGVADLPRDLVPQDPADRYGAATLGANGVITITFTLTRKDLAEGQTAQTLQPDRSTRMRRGLFGWLLFAQPPDPLSIAGIILILGSITLLNRGAIASDSRPS